MKSVAFDTQDLCNSWYSSHYQLPWNKACKVSWLLRRQLKIESKGLAHLAVSFCLINSTIELKDPFHTPKKSEFRIQLKCSYAKPCLFHVLSTSSSKQSFSSYSQLLVTRGKGTPQVNFQLVKSKMTFQMHLCVHFLHNQWLNCCIIVSPDLWLEYSNSVESCPDW